MLPCTESRGVLTPSEAPPATFSDLPDEVSKPEVLRQPCRPRQLPSASPPPPHAQFETCCLQAFRCCCLVQVLALIPALGLSEPRDLACFALINTRCAAMCRAAPLHLAVPRQPTVSPSEEQLAARRWLERVSQTWAGTYAHFAPSVPPPPKDDVPLCQPNRHSNCCCRDYCP
jgi:hypothetical protein